MKIILVERVLAIQQQRMHLPELPLRASRLRGLGGDPALRMQRVLREMAENSSEAARPVGRSRRL